MQSHERRPVRQRLRTWLGTYLGPKRSSCKASYRTQQSWSAAIATSCMRAVHMGLACPHDMETEFIGQVLSESQPVWLARARDGLIKA